MFRRANVTAAAVAIAIYSTACTKPAPNPFFDAAKFDALYHSVKMIQAGLVIGVTYPKFGDVLQTATGELSIAKDNVTTDTEKALLQKFSTGLDAFIDSASVWNLDITDPSTGPWRPSNIMVGATATTSPKIKERIATLNPLIAKYNLPVTEWTNGASVVRVIPADSVRRIWNVAEQRSAEAIDSYLQLRRKDPREP